MKKYENLNDYNRVRINDYTNYDAEKCNNGGCYAFFTDYIKRPDGKWEISYDTTADLEYCPVCGSFENHRGDVNCPYESGYTCGEFKVISEEELLNIINNFEETKEEYVDVLYQKMG